MIISNNLSDNNHLTHLKLQKVKMPHKLKVDNHYTVIGFIYCQIFREIQPRQSFFNKENIKIDTHFTNYYYFRV